MWTHKVATDKIDAPFQNEFSIFSVRNIPILLLL
jgi:hypothetical protein